MFGYGPGDRWLCVLPLFHIAGLAILVRCARAGATAVLADRVDPAALEGVTLVSLVATQLRRLRDAGLTEAPGAARVRPGRRPDPARAAGVGPRPACRSAAPTA